MRGASPRMTAESNKGEARQTMLIKSQEDVTPAVLEAFKNAPDPRVR